MVLFLVLLMGCIKVDINEKIHPDGMADFKMTINMSGMANMGSMIRDNISFGDNTSLENNGPVSGGTGLVSMGMQNSAMPEWCEGIAKNMTERGFTDVHCEADKEQFIITVTAKRKLTEKDGFKKTSTLLGTNYSYRPNMTALLGEEWGNNENSNPAMAKAMGISMTYTVEMPGKITKIENGKIVEGKGVFDLIGDEGKTFYLESEESGIGLLAVVGVALLAIVVIAAFVFIKLMGRKKPAAEAMPVGTAQALPQGPLEIDYDIVKTVRELEKGGHDDSTIAAKLKEMGYSPADIDRIMEMASKVDGVEMEGKAKQLLLALAGGFIILVVVMAAYAIFLA